MRSILVPLVVLACAASVAAQKVAVADAMTIPINAGEAQSTVVPPGKKGQCQQGRFLVTNDRLRPPESVVRGRDLNQTGGATVASTFNLGTLAANYDPTDIADSNYYFGTNDHDLVTLSNGDVLYITGAFTRSPIKRRPGSVPLATPPWFKHAFRSGVCNNMQTCDQLIDFGPNARTNLLVFRSTDCGQTFDYVTEMDPVVFGGGTCALPQFRRDWSVKGAPIITSKPYDMGGSDGQLVKVDPATDLVYATFQCVGYNPDPTKKPEFVLDLKNKINKTMVLVFNPANSSWKSLGYIDQAAWRFGVVPFAGDELAFGFSSSVLYGKKKADGKFEFDSTGVVAPNGSFSWMGEWDFVDVNGNSDVPVGMIGSNVLAVPVVARTPNSKNLILAFPDKFGSKGAGYRVYFYSRAAKTLKELSKDPILPAEADEDNLVFHLAVADPPGGGPVLLYWTDLDSSAKKVTVRGRVITGNGEFTDDFTISQNGGQPASFQLAGNDYWYGDYHTAGAFFRKLTAPGPGPFTLEVPSAARFEYYPMWVEPNGTVRYTRVEYAVEPSVLTKTPLMKVRDVAIRRVPPETWDPQPQPVDLSRIRRAARPVSRERNVRP